MKIVSGETMQSLDRRTIEEFHIPGLVLMENAGRACVDTIISRYGCAPGKVALIFAGKGNNGGDGYVIARLLSDQGWTTEVYILAREDEIGGDAAVNLARLKNATVYFCPGKGELARFSERFSKASVLVDALLGTGLKSRVKEVFQDAINLINNAGPPVLAVDIPSGIDAGSGRILGDSVCADVTVTFAAAKFGNILFPGAEATGVLCVADIGIPKEVLDTASGGEFLDHATAGALLRKRSRQSHKGSFGHCLIIAGSTGKTGAAAMAANSAVRGGAGLVTVTGPASLNTIMEIKTTEAMTFPLPDQDKGFIGEAAHEELATLLEGKSALAIGPGLGTHPETSALVRRLVRETMLPVVVDADGLNALAEDVSVLLQRRTAHVIVTPHPGEMARLTGLTVAEIEADRLGVTTDFSRKYGVYVLLKGARSVIATPEGSIAINGSGNPGMASGGMGDVLTGLMVALLSQHYDPYTACRLGAFLHGFAADLAVAEKGETGLSATDVQERLPFAFNELMKYSEDYHDYRFRHNDKRNNLC
jgi:NAD(P)H-hydrate epimerase